MKNKRIFAIAAALIFSVQAGFATDISGVTGNNGVYNITPEKAIGENGFRHYENFHLSEQDIANLIMQYGEKNISHFINMVDNQINIQGIVNTMRNGGFANGHAVFISPNGMIVGASGVLNVGSLSVLTPTVEKYNGLLKEGAAIDLSNIKNEGNADILVRGKILSRGDVNIQGSNVALPETSAILNGVNANQLLTSQQQANILFNNLVNTNNMNSADKLSLNNGKIVIRANGENGMVNVRGTVTNYNNGNIELINERGQNGLKVTGTITNSNGNLELINKAGKTLVKGDLINDGGFILISDEGKGIHLNSGSNVIANTGSIKIKNNGEEGLAVYGDIQGLDGDVSLENNNGKLYISGNIDYDGYGTFQIVNNAEENSQLMIAKSSNINSLEDVYIKNKADGGLFVNGKIHADNTLTLDNQSGDLTVNNNISAGEGLSLQNTGSKLAISSKATIKNENGNLVIKNSGENGLIAYGKIENNGDTISITNDDGNLLMNGEVKATSGNIGIINSGDMLYMKNKTNIYNKEGRTNIINNGENGLYSYGDITNESDDLYIANADGKLYIDGDINYDGYGTFQIVNNAEENSQLMIAKSSNINSLEDVYIKNKADGGLFVNGKIHADNTLTLDNQSGDLTVNNNISAGEGLSLQNTGSKLAISSKATIKNENGNLVIKNSGENGLISYGKIENNGDAISITNDAGNLNINGEVNAKSGDLGIINNGNQLYLKDKSVVKNADGTTNIINNGAGGLKAVGRIDVDDELNICNNAGQGYIDGYVISNGGDINILSDKDSNGVYIRKNAQVTNLPRIETDMAGNIVIKDTASSAGGGIIIKGNVDSANDVTVISANNNIYTSGSVNAMNDITYSQSAVNGTMTFNKNAQTNALGDVTYQVFNGSKINDMRK